MRFLDSVVLVVTLLTSEAAGASNAGEELSVKEQIVIFDAGSSGTRVHVYDFVWRGTVVPVLDVQTLPAQELKVRPGLSALSTIEDTAELHAATLREFQQLLDFVRQFVPAVSRKDTPLILKATAGLRMVPPAQAERILQAVRTLFLESEFYFRMHRGWADVIPGNEEAGLAWIAANYLHKTFDDRFDEVGRTASVGVVEMGGGSSQVVFSVHDVATLANVGANRQFVFQDFHGHDYHIYAASYLGFGRDHALTRFDKTLSHLGSETNPCHTKGYVAQKGVPQMTGTGSYQDCLARIRELLFNTSVPDQPVVIPGPSDIHAPTSLEGAFWGTEVFYYAREHAPMQGQETWQDFDLSQPKVLELGNRLCEGGVTGGGSDSGSDYKKAAAATVDDGCFSIAFQSAFLELTGATGAHLPVVTKDINNVQVEWALGAAVQYLASITKERSSAGKGAGADAIVGESVTFMLAVSCFAMLMMFLLARAVMQWQPLKIWATRAMRRKRHRGKRNRVKYSKVPQDAKSEFGLGGRTSKTEDNSSVVVEMQVNSRAARGPVALKWKMSDEGFSESEGGLPAI